MLSKKYSLGCSAEYDSTKFSSSSFVENRSSSFWHVLDQNNPRRPWQSPFPQKIASSPSWEVESLNEPFTWIFVFWDYPIGVLKLQFLGRNFYVGMKQICFVRNSASSVPTLCSSSRRILKLLISDVPISLSTVEVFTWWSVNTKFSIL